MAASALLANPDQRKYLRFKLSFELHYAIRSGPSGDGQLLNIGSGGLLFRCNTILKTGKLIQIVLPWPFLLDGDCPLKLCIRGRVLRSNPEGTAVALLKYEFRTAGRVRTSAADVQPQEGRQ